MSTHVLRLGIAVALTLAALALMSLVGRLLIYQTMRLIRSGYPQARTKGGLHPGKKAASGRSPILQPVSVRDALSPIRASTRH